MKEGKEMKIQEKKKQTFTPTGDILLKSREFKQNYSE